MANSNCKNSFEIGVSGVRWTVFHYFHVSGRRVRASKTAAKILFLKGPPNLLKSFWEYGKGGGGAGGVEGGAQSGRTIDKILLYFAVIDVSRSEKKRNGAAKVHTLRVWGRFRW